MALKNGKKVLRTLADPIIEEFPLFVITLVIATVWTLQYLHGCIVAHYGFEAWKAVFSFISIAVVFSYIFTLITFYTKKKSIKIVCYAIPVILFIINLFLKLNFGTILNPTYILILGETNPNEASDFLDTFLFNKNGTITFGTLLTICLLIFIAEKYKHLVIRNANQYLKYTICILVVPFLLGGLYNLTKTLSIFNVSSMKQLDEWGGWMSINKISETTDVYSNLLYSLYAPKVAQKEYKRAIKISRSLSEDVKADNDSLNLVLVIGESYIKYHSPLYGYYLNTTPKQLQEYKNKHLYAFDNIITPYNSTTLAIKNLLSSNCVEFKEEWQEEPYIPSIFNKEGYKVYFWDNQNQAAVWNFTLNSFLHNKELSEVSYTAENKDTYQYDGGLIQSFLSQHFPTTQNNLTILHLWGQHVAAKDHYPHTARFNHFTRDSITVKKPWLTSAMRQAIAEYDNATYYNDALIGEVINHYRHANAVIVYLSDHGEETYDWRPGIGRNASPMCANVLKYQFDIPFVVWCSDKYQARHPRIMQAIKASLHKPMSSDIICNMLFHLAGMKTEYYRPSLDILSKKYRCPKRIVLDKYNYDTIRFHK